MLKRILFLLLLAIPILVVAFGCGGGGAPKAYIIVENSASSTTNIVLIAHEDTAAADPIIESVNIPPGGTHQITAKPNCLYYVAVMWLSTATDMDTATLTEGQTYAMTFLEP